MGISVRTLSRAAQTGEVSMNLLGQNRLLSGFLMMFGIAIVAGVWFLLAAKNEWGRAVLEFKEVAAELNRLESLAPYPSGENLRRFKAEVHDYGDGLVKLREELKGYVLPIESIAPNEFQARLHLAITSLEQKARAAKVRLPEKFYFGFDEFAAGLPNALAAPRLGQELAQIESLFDILLEARVEAVTAFHRIVFPEEQGTVLIPTSGSKPGTAQKTAGKSVDRNVVEASFISTPAVARKVLNQIVTNRQFFIVRLLQIRNEKDKGPPREFTTDLAAPSDSASTSGSVSSPEARNNGPLIFIVGNEHIEVAAKIEIVRFSL